jgi:hypothetical protein
VLKKLSEEEIAAAFAPGHYLDWENNTLYGANGKVYRGLTISLDALLRRAREEGKLSEDEMVEMERRLRAKAVRE